MRNLNPKIASWAHKRVWIIGASSGIGAALVPQLQQAGAHLALSARREAPLIKLATKRDIVLSLNSNDLDALRIAHQKIISQWQHIDLVIYCAGTYSPMRAWNLSMETVRETFEVNLFGAYQLLDVVLPDLLKKGSGSICLVASVAGYTGLPKALAYGPSKAAMINLAQVLYNDLSARGIGVTLVNPGFVKTRLTQQNDFTMPALTSPEVAAAEIIKGLAKGQFEIHFPRRFTLWMKLLAMLPSRLRLPLINRAA